MAEDARDESRPRLMGPLVAPPGASPAEANRPDSPLDARWNSYEANPAPWWIGVLWASFSLFGLIYLLRSMLS